LAAEARQKLPQLVESATSNIASTSAEERQMALDEAQQYRNEAKEHSMKRIAFFQKAQKALRQGTRPAAQYYSEMVSSEHGTFQSNLNW
jgi:hypothetical protein